MAHTLEELSLLHPCFAQGGLNDKGRIHLPVSPGCNIQCKFCVRKIDDEAQAPGVSADIITPQEAADAVARAVAAEPGITVAGIAGPGDTLASPHALETFRLVKRRFPNMLACMSTNGLMLPDKVDEIVEVGVDTLTVTVNAVDPAIQEQICSHAIYHGRTYTGTDAARLLITNQLEGIRAASAAGITVKVNTVLVPEINADHVPEVARSVADAGASLYNIIPLIPQGELAWCSTPDCALLGRLRVEAGECLQVFCHCQRCRADAVGILGGTDISRR
ncbi:MAG: radical SAM protein, partial [Atopobiaceae bacterium]|nr:radical SAM protein [Atopobiaceae bacterium]